jgi:8-oxo-dGTP pyrophosphatase MutT (NUDIX family)
LLPVNFLSDQHPLLGEDAVAAIITTKDGRYLLQLRDDIPRIFYPGHWGCFGGAVGPGEDMIAALKRELAEELELHAETLNEFVKLEFDLAPIGQKYCYRAYYEMVVSEEQVSGCVLHEGADLRLFSAPELFSLPHITPYDSFALWLHFARIRFQKGAEGLR